MEKVRVPAALALTGCGTVLARTLAIRSASADRQRRGSILADAGAGVLLFVLSVLAAGSLRGQRQDGHTPGGERLH